MLFTLYARSPFWMNMVAGPTSAYLSILMNIIVFVALFDKKIQTPSTVIMQGLALADGFTALCTYGLEPLFATKYEQIGIPGTANLIDIYGPSISIVETKELVYLQFPYCLLHYYLTNLADTFHLVSILLTMSLGVQKLLAVACPIWSRTKMTVLGSMIVCGMCFMFSFVINIPRILVVSLSEGTEGTCLMSEPKETIQKYVLTYYPVLFTIILTIAVMAMLASTCYIIVILCRRKYIRGHATASKSEKKSCTLIVCVMTVFLLSEIPRLYLNASVFHTFRSDVDKDNMALYRVGKEVEVKSFSCLASIAKRLVEKAKVQQNMSIESDESCVTGLMDLPQYWRELTHEFMSMTEKCFLLDPLRDKIKPIYYSEVLSDVYGKILISEKALHNNRQLFLRKSIILYCNGFNKPMLQDLLNYFLQHLDCYEDVDLVARLAIMVLGSTPYSEPMNYILNIIWGQSDFSLKNLKVLIEILKLSMIVGCASNFFIYIVMSQNLRETFKAKFKFWQRQR